MEEEKQKQAKSSAEEVVGEGGPVKVGGDGEGGPVKVGGDGLASGAGRSAEVVQVGGSSGSTDGMPNQPLVSETRKRDREGGDQVDTDIELPEMPVDNDIEIPEMEDQNKTPEIRKRGREDEDQGDLERASGPAQRDHDGDAAMALPGEDVGCDHEADEVGRDSAKGGVP